MTRTIRLALLLMSVAIIAVGMSLIGCVPAETVGTRVPEATEEPAAVHLTKTAEAVAVQTIVAALAEEATPTQPRLLLPTPTLVPETATAAVLTPTPTPLPTDTPVRPTDTPQPPTNTPVPPTDTPLPQPYAVIPAGGLNVRRGPGTAYGVLAFAQGGQRFDIVARNAAGDWWQICCLAGERGWVFAGLAQSGGAIDGIPVAADIPAPPTATAAPVSAVAGPPSLLEPADDALLLGDTTTVFRWEWSGRLAANQWFDVTFRQGDELAFRQAKAASLELGQKPLEYGEYEWWVRIGEWDGDPAAGGRFIRHMDGESEHRRFRWVRGCHTEEYECNCRWVTDPITLERRRVCDTCTRQVCD